MKRSNINRLMSALLIAISLMGVVAVAVAQKGAGNAKGEGGSCDAGCYIGCFGGDASLSDAQKVQIQERIERHRETTAGLREQLKTLREQSSSKEDGNPIDEAAVRAAAQTRANLRIELEVAEARLMSELRALLTPEQKARRAEQQRQRQERIRNLRSRREPTQQF